MFIISPRTAMQREKHPCRSLDLGDSFEIQVLLCFSLDHTLEHAVHVANGGSEVVNPGCLDELSRLLRRAQLPTLSRFLDFGSGSYVTDFPLCKNRGVDS